MLNAPRRTNGGNLQSRVWRIEIPTPRSTSRIQAALLRQGFGEHPTSPFSGLDPANRVNAKQDGAQGRNRTTDTAIFSRMLYQLSYLGVLPERSPGRAPVYSEPGASCLAGADKKWTTGQTRGFSQPFDLAGFLAPIRCPADAGPLERSEFELNPLRHPEARAQRASKDARPGPVALRGPRCARPPQDDGLR